MSSEDRRTEAGFATVVLPMVLWTATLVAIVSIDIGAYLVAASRAQALADAAALAAVSEYVVGAVGGSPREAAADVVTAGEGELVGCSCVAGREVASVGVSVEVPGLVIPTLGARRVIAVAQAMLAPPEGTAPGPTRRRAAWVRPPGG